MEFVCGVKKVYESGECFKENNFESQWNCNFEVKILTVEILLEEIREPSGGV